MDRSPLEDLRWIENLWEIAYGLKSSGRSCMDRSPLEGLPWREVFREVF